MTAKHPCDSVSRESFGADSSDRGAVSRVVSCDQKKVALTRTIVSEASTTASTQGGRISVVGEGLLCLAGTTTTAFDVCTPKIQGAGMDTFRVCSELGHGSFGTVYKVEEKKTGISYAMKVQAKDKFLKTGRLRYAITERNVQSSMSHPFIVGLVCAFQTSHELVLVMPLCSGGSLEALVKGAGGLPELLCRSYFSEVFLAIEHIHSRNVAYRDLKSANVVLDDDGHAMLTDFGLSKQMVSEQSNTFLGSISHVAPEIVARRAHGKAVDVYGLGVLLFEMLAGGPPFVGECRRHLFQNILTAELKVPPFVSDDCASILRSLMARDLDKRLGAANTTDIRGHPFLATVDLDAVLRREVPREVPMIPLRSRLSTHLGHKDGAAHEGVRTLEPFRRGSIFRRRRVRGWEFPESGPERAFGCRSACLVRHLVRRDGAN